jgi:hypothetical protein
MGLFVVESTVVAIHRVSTGFAYIAELHRIAAEMDYVSDVVVLI